MNAATRLTRRRLAGAGLGAAALLAAPYGFVRRARAEIPKGSELTIGVWGGTQERIVTEHCAKPLQERYGCKVNFVLGGTPERRAKAYAERGSPSFDIVYLNIFESRQAVKDGVTQAGSDAVPNFAQLYDAAKVGGYGVAFNPITIVYDRRRVATPITSWKDLWRPELKGRVALPSYPGAEGTAALVMAARVWGGGEEAIDVGFDKLAELKPYPAIASSQDQLFTLFDQGLCDASVEISGYCQIYKETRNQDLVLADPVEGKPLAMNVACITIGTRNQELAEQWVDLHLGEPCQTAYARELYYGPTSKVVQLPADLAPKVTYGPDQVKKLLAFDWDTIIKNQGKWSSRFNRSLAG